MKFILLFVELAIAASCPAYVDYSTQKHAPYSTGQYQLSYQRPSPACRTFNSSSVNSLISGEYKNLIRDPDLYRLFQNSWPNTLDTTIAWHGFANNDPSTGQELTFVITGDINAMWFRDSANQMQSYLSVLTPSTSTNSIASLFRGAINLQARYLLINPYCNSYQPPVESNIAPAVNGAASDDTVKPPFNNQTVFECKYELDSLAAFLELSYNYYNRTQDVAFFQRFQWIAAVNTVLNTAEAMMIGTYASDGSVNNSPYTFTRLTTTASDTLTNSGRGEPVAEGTGLIRSAFRPSDDATTYQLFIPANMMFSSYLSRAAQIANQIPGQKDLASRMTALSNSLRAAITSQGIVQVPGSKQSIYAYEVDGFGSTNFVDDANIPSLLSAPVYGYLSLSDPVYQATRARVLSSNNPYYMRGPVISAVGGPHDGPGKAWPMASITRIMTSNDDNEISTELKHLVSSTNGLGLIHESINTFNQTDYTRQWFAWANGLFGEMIVDLAARKPYLLAASYQ